MIDQLSILKTQSGHNSVSHFILYFVLFSNFNIFSFPDLYLFSFLTYLFSFVFFFLIYFKFFVLASFSIKFPKHFFTNFITTTGELERQIKILDVNVTYILFIDKKIVNIHNYYNTGFIFCYLSKYYCFYIKNIKIYTKSCFLFYCDIITALL